MVKDNYMAKVRKKNNKSKYQFDELLPNGIFTIKQTDYNSMLTSLRAYNERHGSAIDVKCEDDKPGQFLITRIS